MITPSIMPPTLLISFDFLTPPLPVMHTPMSLSCMPLTYPPTLWLSFLSLPTTTSATNSLPLDDLNLPITLHKGTRAYTQHLIAHFVSYEHLSPTYHTFALVISFESLLHSYNEAFKVLE